MWYYGYMTATATGQTRPRYQSDPSPQAYSGNITLSDGANVTLANGATASLYSYTPYIQSFDTIFSGWFGPPNGTPIIQISGDPTEYLVWGDSYYPIPSSAVLAAWGYGSTPITPTSSTYLTSLKQGPTLSILAKFGSNQTAYLIDSGKSNGFPNGTIYSDYGYTFGTSETAYSASLQNAVAVGSTMTPIAQAPDGAVYQVTANKKDIFPDYQTFSTLGSPVYSSRPVVNLSSAYVNQIPSGPPMLLNGKFVRQSDGSSIYIYDQGSLYLLTPQAYQAWGGELDYSFPSILLNQLPSNGVAPVFAMSPDGTKYMIDSGRKLGMAADVQAAWGVANSSFANMSYQLLNRLLDANLSTLTQGSSQAVYLVQGGQTHVFPSGSDLTSYGYTRNLISQVSDYSISQQVSGAPAYAPGSLLRAPDGTIYWIDAGFQSMTIPSLAVFDTFGFNTLSSMRNIDSSTANSFTNRGVLSNIIKASDGTYYLVDSGVKLLISANAYSSSQFNFASHATTQVSTGIAATITNGYALTQYIQGSGQTIYMVNSGQKQPFGSPSSFFAHGGTWASVIHLSDDFINSLPTGAGL